MRELEQWLPLEVTQRSRALMLLAGVALLQVTRNLARRKALAWWVAVGALSVSLLSHVGRAFDLHHSMVAALLLAYLLVYRRRFNARSDPASLRQALVMAPGAGGAGLGLRGRSASPTCATSSRGTRATRRRSRPCARACSRSTPASTRRPSTPRASWARCSSWAGRRASTCSCCVLRPVILRRRQEAPAEAVARAVREHGRSSLSAFAAQERQAPPAGRGGPRAGGLRRARAASPSPPATRSVRRRTSRARPPSSWSTAGRNGWTPCFYEAAEERAAGLPRASACAR